VNLTQNYYCVVIVVYIIDKYSSIILIVVYISVVHRHITSLVLINYNNPSKEGSQVMLIPT